MVTSVLFNLFFLSTALASPSRIVTLSPALAEMVVDVKKSDQEIVGVTEYSDVPPTLKNKTSVGPYFKVDLEKIVSLKPTHIFATEDGNDKSQIERLKSFGFHVVVTRSSRLSDIPSTYKVIGTELGDSENANTLAAEFSKKIDQLKKDHALTAGQHKKRVMVQIGDAPLVVVGGKGFLSEVITLSGLDNVFGELEQAYPKVSKEEVFLRKPDLILFLSMSSSDSEIQKITSRWKSLGFKNVKALKGDRIVRPTLKIFEGVDLLLKAQND